jgi:hypothetical protein
MHGSIRFSTPLQQRVVTIKPGMYVLAGHISRPSQKDSSRPSFSTLHWVVYMVTDLMVCLPSLRSLMAFMMS